MARGSFKYTEADRAEMVRLAKMYGSFRRAAREFGTSYSTVIDACNKAGFHIPSPAEKSLTIRSITVDGIKFSLVGRGHYYRRHVGDKDETLSQYMYRKANGKEKPKGVVVMFRDGNRDNYDPNNIYWVTASEATKAQMLDQERYEMSKAALVDGGNRNRENERRNPLLMKRRMRRAWTTRRAKDPDNEWTQKMNETRRKNAEARGYFFDEESRKHMSESHMGNTKEVLRAKRNEREKMAIRAKLGF